MVANIDKQLIVADTKFEEIAGMPEVYMLEREDSILVNVTVPKIGAHMSVTLNKESGFTVHDGDEVAYMLFRVMVSHYLRTKGPSVYTEGEELHGTA